MLAFIFGFLKFTLEKSEILNYNQSLKNIYIIGVIIVFAFLITATIFLIKCFHDNTYLYLSRLDLIEKYLDEYQEYYNEEISKDPNIPPPNDALVDVYITNFIKIHKRNRKTNLTRIKHLYKVNFFICLSLISITILLFPFLIRSFI